MPQDRRGEVVCDRLRLHGGKGGRGRTASVKRTSISPTSVCDPAVLLTMSTLPGPNVSRHSFHASYAQVSLGVRLLVHLLTLSSGTNRSSCGIVFAVCQSCT